MADPPPVAARGVAFLVTCEHAGRAVPARWRHRFADAEAALASHRGYDPGARGVAVRLAARLAAPLLLTRVSRLVVEVNRLKTSPELFSPYMQGLTPAERQAILDEHYHPYRNQAARLVQLHADAGLRVIHLSVHSFTDVLDGVTRELDLGLLFDPARPNESGTASQLRAGLARAAPELDVRDNQPYLGVDDGLTTALRGQFDDHAYAGIEIEIRQSLVRDATGQQDIAQALSRATAAVDAA